MNESPCDGGLLKVASIYFHNSLVGDEVGGNDMGHPRHGWRCMK
jgi:hypothetical protein